MIRTLTVVACLTSSLALSQAVPGSMAFNARLSDTSGAPVTGSHALTFGLYDTLSGGAALWTESVSAAGFSSDGLAFVELGATTPLTTTVLDGRKLFLEVSVDGTALSPRLAIVSVPYALRASVAATAASVGSLTESAIQRRIIGTCPAGQAVRSIDASGAVQCEPLPSGDVTSVSTAAGSGLSGGSGSGDVALSLASCANGQVLMSNGAGWNCTTAVGPQGPAGAAGAPGAAGSIGPQGPVGPPGTVDTGCPAARIGGSCVLTWDNTQTTNFQQAAQRCAFAGGDLCTDSQSWPVSVGSWQNVYLSTTVLQGAHWTSSFADNDSASWIGSNGGTGDDHSPNSSYGYACCGGWTPNDPLVPTQTIANVKVKAVHNVADTYWSGAVAYCAALNTDICSDSQTYLLRQAGALTVPAWTNSHSDNDGTLYNGINGGTNDDTHPSNVYGFACCSSTRPVGGTCPVALTSGVCAVNVHNVADASFGAAAAACAALNADICSTAQESVLRTAGTLSVPTWSNSHSDNDSSNASVGVGAMADNPSLTANAGYACCPN